jgi:hypothetical protein
MDAREGKIHKTVRGAVTGCNVYAVLLKQLIRETAGCLLTVTVQMHTQLWESMGYY